MAERGRGCGLRSVTHWRSACLLSTCKALIVSLALEKEKNANLHWWRGISIVRPFKLTRNSVICLLLLLFYLLKERGNFCGLFSFSFSSVGRLKLY